MIQAIERKYSRYWVVEYDPFYEPGKGEPREQLTVTSEIEMGSADKWGRAVVGWHSIRTVGIAEAAIFSQAIRMAIEKGKEMNKAHGIS
jgi:hypothetical protein